MRNFIIKLKNRNSLYHIFSVNLEWSNLNRDIDNNRVIWKEKMRDNLRCTQRLRRLPCRLVLTDTGLSQKKVGISLWTSEVIVRIYRLTHLLEKMFLAVVSCHNWCHFSRSIPGLGLSSTLIRCTGYLQRKLSWRSKLKSFNFEIKLWITGRPCIA